jgi:hypothetical protein
VHRDCHLCRPPRPGDVYRVDLACECVPCGLVDHDVHVEWSSAHRRGKQNLYELIRSPRTTQVVVSVRRSLQVLLPLLNFSARVLRQAPARTHACTLLRVAGVCQWLNSLLVHPPAPPRCAVTRGTEPNTVACIRLGLQPGSTLRTQNAADSCLKHTEGLKGRGDTHAAQRHEETLFDEPLVAS